MALTKTTTIRVPFFAGVLLYIIFAGQHCDRASHAHGPMDGHAHGRAHLDLALESDGILRAEFRIPGETLYGFEHRARTAAEKRKIKSAISEFTRQFTRLTRFPPDANCAIAWQEPVSRGTTAHAEVHASFQADCGNLAPGGSIQIRLSRALPGLQTLVVRIITAKGARELVLEKGDGNIKL